MLGATPFYHSTIRNLISGFGTLFNDITIERKSDNNVVQTISVPLSYGPKQFWYYRSEDPNAGNVDPNQTTQLPVAVVLPRMSYEMMGIRSNWQEHPSLIQKHLAITTNQGTLNQTYMHVPVFVDFDLTIVTKNLSDSLQIVEQIIPWFTPDLVVQMKLMPEFDRVVDVTINLQYPLTYTDNWDEAFNSRRDIMWTLSFTANCNIYGPIREKKIILEAIINAYAGLDDTEPAATVTVTPDPPDAKANEEFGFTITRI